MAEQVSRQSDSAEDVGNALLRLTHWFEQNQTYSARKLGLHSTDFACIGYLVTAAGPVSPKQIIQHLGLSSSAGTALLDRLEKAGYIRRQPNPDDRRGLLISLDTKAAAAPIAFYRMLSERVTATIARHSEAERRVITRFLSEISATSEGLVEPD